MRAAALLLLAAVSARAADDAACRAEFSIPKVLAAAARSEAAPGREVEDAMRWELLAYYKWLAFAAGDPSRCAPLKSLAFPTDTHGTTTGEHLCRDLYHRLAFVRGYVERDPAIHRLCMENVVNEGDDPGPEQMERYRRSCAIIVRRDRTPEVLCPQAIPLMPFPPEKRPKHEHRCVCDFDSMNDRETCAEDPGNNPEGFLGPRRYDSLSAFAKAWKAKDPGRCGDLELCRGLMGQGKKMAELHARKAAEIRCGSPADIDFSKLTLEQKKAICLSDVTPEAMIVRQFGDVSREGLYDYATCEELVKRAPSLCGWFPGGPSTRIPAADVLKRYTVVGSDAKVRRDFEWAVCDSRSAGYLLLAGLVRGEPRESLLPFARRMLDGEKGVEAGDLVDASSEVYHARRAESARLPRLARAGFFRYLLGPESCAGVALPKLRRECEWKGAAVAALRAGDPALCARGDLMCRALFDGEAACRESGREAVRRFCETELGGLKPTPDDWAAMRDKL